MSMTDDIDCDTFPFLNSLSNIYPSKKIDDVYEQLYEVA
jgi:hypothetical protein